MKKADRIIFMFIIISLLFLEFSMVHGAFSEDLELEYIFTEGTSKPYGVYYDTVHDVPATRVIIAVSSASDATGQSAQRKIVRNSDGILYAVYPKYKGSIVGDRYQIYVKESIDDGKTWANETRISIGITNMAYDHQYSPSIAVDSNDNLHVVWNGMATGFIARVVWYANGTDGWATPVQLSTQPDSDNEENVWASIAIDSNDYLHVVYTSLNSGIWYKKYTTSWASAVLISTYAGMDVQQKGASVIAVDSNDYLHVVFSCEATGYESHGQIWYNKYNTSWAGPVRISTYAGMESYDQSRPSIAVDSNDYIHVIWDGRVSGESITVRYANYTESWATPVILQQIGQNKYPSLKWSTYNMWSEPGPGYPSDPVPSNMDTNQTIEGAICEFSTYWDDLLDDGLDYWIFSWNASGSYVNDTAVFFTGNPDTAWSNVTKTLPAYPKTIKWKIYANDTLDNWGVTPEQELSIIPSWNATVTFLNLESFEWGSGFGDSAFWYTNNSWVFEGKKRYGFQVYYENFTLTTIEQFGVRFTDEAGQVHSIMYNKDANTLTVISPNDGISGWIHSFTQTGTNSTAIFHIMFNKPIPDSYGIQLEVRVIAVADSGWLTPEGGIFNIYNLGGLATLYKSGTAGRIPGGDIFEIYAADTRTRNIIPVQDFDVRVSSLAPGVQIGGIQIIPAEDEQKLLDELSGWKIWMTSRTETRTIYPTNRLPATGSSGDKTYNSYPFGLLIKSDSTLNQSLIIEKQFFRKIYDTDNEIVTAEIWATVANDTKITGQILISDDGYVDDLLKGLVTDTKRIVDFKFYGNGSIRLVDGIFNIYPATYTGMVWANYTFVMNLTAQTYDFYVDEVLNATGVEFREAATSVGHISFLDTLNPVFPAQPVEFYVDDVWVHTDFDEVYGGVAEATMLFDKNQHWSMDFDFFVEQGQIYAQGASGTPRRIDDDYSNYGYIELGWDVMIDKTLVHDFLVARVNITDGYISGKNNWIQFNVSWYKQGVYVKNDLLYGLFEGYSIWPGGEKDTAGFHWDIWFNRANASTIVGARLNTEYFGLSDKSVWWAIWSSKWTPMRSEVSESTLFIDLEDINGTIHSANDVSFVRSWVKILRNTQAQFAYKVLNIAGLDFLVAIDTMSGIDTPPIRETLVPEVLSGLFGSALGGIFSAALKRLGNALAGFGMGFFTLSIDFIDNVFAALGYPALVSTIFGWMNSLFASVPTLIGYGITMIGNVFNLINVSASNTLIQLASVITIWVDMYSTTMDLLTGVLTPGINLWNDLGVNSFIQVGAILYPVWLLMMWMDKGGQAVFDHLNSVLNIGSFFLNFILNVGGFFINLLDSLIGAIRG